MGSIDVTPRYVDETGGGGVWDTGSLKLRVDVIKVQYVVFCDASETVYTYIFTEIRM
jgi:hypothetical protein